MQVDTTRATRMRATVNKEAAPPVGLRSGIDMNRDPMITPCSTRGKVVPMVLPHLRRFNPVLTRGNWTDAIFAMTQRRIIEFSPVIRSAGHGGIDSRNRTTHGQKT